MQTYLTALSAAAALGGAAARSCDPVSSIAARYMCLGGGTDGGFPALAALHPHCPGCVVMWAGVAGLAVSIAAAVRRRAR
ncbi:hypothetical protein GC169_11745 [bacterium]|nr:hypothetical protein [bacterium]